MGLLRFGLLEEGRRVNESSSTTVTEGELRPWAPDAARKEARDVQRMFAAVSPRYDFLNRLLSFGQDLRWRRRAVALAKLEGDERVLDVATGTADLALSFATRTPRGRVTGVDFCTPMLRLAQRKIARAKPRDRIALAAGDALRLPFRDESFDVVTAGFGVRNFQDLAAGLREMARVLRPQGRVILLEFTTPETRFSRTLTSLYLRIVPAIGRRLSGSGTDAYRYLAESIRRFPSRAAFQGLLESCGFEQARSVPLAMGLVAVTVAQRSG